MADILKDKEVKIPKYEKSLKHSFSEYTDSTHKNGIRREILGRTLKVNQAKYNSHKDRWFVRFEESYNAVIAIDIYNLLNKNKEELKESKEIKLKLTNRELFGI